MTIFQKMLFTPVLALILFSVVNIYSYVKQQQNSQNIENFSEEYIPILEIANQNIALFNQINQQIKDAIVASELTWLDTVQNPTDLVMNNLTALENYSSLVDASETAMMRTYFNNYSQASTELAQQAIEKGNIFDVNTDLIEKVEEHQRLSNTAFLQFSVDIKARFLNEVKHTNRELDNLLVTSILISVASLVALLLMTLYISLSTRKSIMEVIIRMKQLASGSTDFSQRLEHDKKDEISYLIHWFNKLSDKLEANYLEVERVSITDSLTGLNNRTRCDQFLPNCLENVRKDNSYLAVAILDIDHFKSINDQHGHLVGDVVLKEVATLLKVNAEHHEFIGRWGGEEFIIVKTGTEPSEFYQRIDGLRQQIASHEFTQVKDVTASFGIAAFEATDNIVSLFERADEALYEAKSAGRNCVRPLLVQ